MDLDDRRRTARERLHIIEAMLTAIDRRADLVALVADCDSVDSASVRLQIDWGMSDQQAQAALDLQVLRFTGHWRSQIADERDDLVRELTDLDR